MPTWLVVILAVWGAMFPVVAAGWKWAAGINRLIGSVSQWFDSESALGKQYGTLPSQVSDLQRAIEGLLSTERILPRLQDVETRVQVLQESVNALEEQIRAT